jgi:hypothetical protein
MPKNYRIEFFLSSVTGAPKFELWIERLLQKLALDPDDQQVLDDLDSVCLEAIKQLKAARKDIFGLSFVEDVALPFSDEAFVGIVKAVFGSKSCERETLIQDLFDNLPREVPQESWVAIGECVVRFDMDSFLPK